MQNQSPVLILNSYPMSTRSSDQAQEQGNQSHYGGNILRGGITTISAPARTKSLPTSSTSGYPVRARQGSLGRPAYKALPC